MITIRHLKANFLDEKYKAAYTKEPKIIKKEARKKRLQWELKGWIAWTWHSLPQIGEVTYDCMLNYEAFASEKLNKGK